MMDPNARVAALEAVPQIPAGLDERLAGYGITGVSFTSGHVLAFQRFPALNIGRPHASVWHRVPDGAWALYVDGEPRSSLGRYVGAAVAEVRRTPIALRWLSPWSLAIEAPEAGLFWHVRLGETADAALASRALGLLPGWALRSRALLTAAGAIGGVLLRAGEVALTGVAPNGQRFRAVPRQLWAVRGSVARLNGVDLGVPGSLPERVRLGELVIPHRGLFVVGAAHFEPFDPARHLETAGERPAAPAQPALLPA